MGHAARAPPGAVGSDALGGCGRTGMLPLSCKARGSPPRAVGMGGLCWWVGGRLRRSGVLVPNAVTVSLEAACQGVGTRLRAPYLQSAPGGSVAVPSHCQEGFAGWQLACLSLSPSAPCWERGPALGCAFLQLQTSVFSRNGKPFWGSMASFMGFMFSFLVLTTGRDSSWCSTNLACAGLHLQPAPGFLK